MIALIVTLAVSESKAQLRTSTLPNIQQGQFIDFGGVYPNASDTLQVSDTVAYIIPITHNNEIAGVFHQFYFKKVGSGNPTITVSYYQSNDLTTFFPVTKGSAQSTYVKTFTPTTSTWNYVNFTQDSAKFDARYLKVQFMTSSTSSVGGNIVSRLKTYYR